MAHRLSPQAEAELDAIWDHIATQSGSADIAERFIASLTDRFTCTLAAHISVVAATTICDRECAVFLSASTSSSIAYRVENDEVLILHLVRGSRNLEALFGH